MARFLARFSGFCLFALSTSVLSAQLNINPSIGIGPLPADSDPVCTIPLYLGDFQSSGLQNADTASDFTLYQVNGDSFNLKTELLKGKPILLVNGSYTCPVYRAKVAQINNVAATYGSQISTLIVYTVEAHPDIDTSPYFGYVNTGQANINAGILYRQPTTYGERKAVVQDMIDSMQPNVPVLIDGPCNEWWAHYGPAPNNAYLIDADGIVFSKHKWFDKFPNDIICDIDSLLGNPTNCGTVANGTFELVLTSDTLAVGYPGDALYATADIVNNSASDVLVFISRMQNNIPTGWETSMCIDVCLASSQDTTTVLVPAGETQPYIMYFFTDQDEESGNTRMLFRNKNLPQNRYRQGFDGQTSISVGVEEPELGIKVWPNPAHDFFKVSVAESGVLELFNPQGQRVLSDAVFGGENSINSTGLPNGLYLYKVTEGDNRCTSGLLVIE